MTPPPNVKREDAHQGRDTPSPAAPRAGSRADLDPQRPTAHLLIRAYANAIFPMADPDTGAIEWFSPDPRGILPLDASQGFHIPKNLARELRKQRFQIRSDTAFERVMRACNTDRDPDNRSWINERLIAAYIELHHMGHAHSVEAWLGDSLVGGLYGVHLNAAFFGESMFTRADLGGSNSSKVCLVHLVRWLQCRGFLLLDTQFWNPHLNQFGCTEISAAQYQQLLAQALRKPATWGQFEPKAS